MEITNKQALKALQTIKDYCKGRKCKECVYCTGMDVEGFICTIGRQKHKNPCNWEIPSVPRWTKTDKALAEALKLAGVEEVMRLSETHSLLLLSNNHSIADHKGLLNAFHDLKPGESISLEEIVNSKGEREND